MLKAVAQMILLLLLVSRTSAQPATGTALLVKTLGVAQGLPQSFISGLVQDAQGFVWIGTRDGLARYDGRKFKVFNHTPGDTTSLAANIISNLYLDSKGRLWILYESGELDVLNTTTEALIHLTSLPAYKAAYNALKGNYGIVRSFAEDGQGNIWLPGVHEGIFIFNLEKSSLHFYTCSSLGLAGNPVFGFASQGQHILLATDTALVTMDVRHRIIQITPYRFSPAYLHDTQSSLKDAYPISRTNGDVVILDETRLIVYGSRRRSFKIFPLPFRKLYVGPNIMQDEKSNVYFDFKGHIYRLSAENALTIWRQKNGLFPESLCMIKDRSGMLWVGGNGYGIQLYDQRLTHLQGRSYKSRFAADVLKELNVSQSAINRSLLKGLDPYLFRWTKSRDGTLWFTNSGAGPFEGKMCQLKNGQLTCAGWQVERSADDLRNISALAFSSSGKLWGIDYRFRPVYIDIEHHKLIPDQDLLTEGAGANSLVIDGEEVFWISTTSWGLFRYDRGRKQARQYVPDASGGGFPSTHPTILLQDPADSGKLWIGTLGNGLLHFDKRSGQCRSYTTKNRLPNNTVYAILPDARGRLWCSTNKGIFRFDPKTGNVYSLTAKDGLPGDEFNRFHFLSLPDGRMAFGGVDGYTIFDPLTVSDDDFNPDVAITDIAINNAPADAGSPGSPLRQAVNSLGRIELPYQSNFLTFEFAALEYNVPEKLNYRYKLQGFDKEWVNAGHGNTAVYTNLPPGNYTLVISATNTAGKWSSNMKRLKIVIYPPFWKTGWFILLCCLAAAALIYLAIHLRLTAIRSKEKQQLAFERKAMELEAQALRAQMNPHFIFNCLNSIKSLIQEDKKVEAVTYLTTFSKLIRNQLSNAQKEISLHDELETCKLYVRLEGLRFGNKITSAFSVDDTVDTHSIMVPPLIIQPFIENAIWHGILPLEKGGHVTVCVTAEPGIIQCVIEDNGIGRERSQVNKSKTSPTHQSKGMQLIIDRLDLHSRIYNRGGKMLVADKKDDDGHAAGTRITLYFKNDS